MLWFLIWMIRGVGAYDPNNLNPTLADPLAAIKCGGPIPLIQYPIHFQQRRLDVSVQLLCAQSQYGGYPSHFNQGGYCSTRSLDGRRIVTFRQQSPDFPISPRLRAYCQLRCTCSGVSNEATTAVTRFSRIQHRAHPHAVQLIDLSSRKAGTIELSSEGSSIGISERFIRIPIESHTYQPTFESIEGGDGWYGDQLVALSKKNLIVCKGDIPESLPHPAKRESFNTLQELCAVYLSGGNETMNAGGFCHHTRTMLGRKLIDILFADEMTPLKEWTWGWPDYFSRTELSTDSFPLRQYCYRKCRCALQDQLQPKRPWADLFSLRMKDPLKYLDALGGQSKGISESSSSSSLCSTATSSCFGFGSQYQLIKDYLPTAWDPSSQTKMKSVSSGVCKVSCQSPRDCLDTATDDCSYTGQCVVDPSSMQRVLGSLGKVVTLFASRCVLKRTRPRRLSGRDMEMTNSWPCACNATYVSHGCCAAPDGIVLEAPHLEIGPQR